MLDPEELAFRKEVEERTGRSFERVQEQLGDLFEMEWEHIEIAISTSSSKGGRSEVDVVADLIAKADQRERPAVTEKARRAVLNWAGRRIRERDNPWNKYADRVKELRADGERPKPRREDPW